MLLSILLVAMDQIAMASLSDDIEVGWGQDHSFFYKAGTDDKQTLALCLDETHGSGFHTKEAYLYARFDIDIRLVPKNSAGTVTTLYVSLHAMRVPCLGYSTIWLISSAN
jgi:xyloglucan:xyloglucosyl transferase